VPEGQFTAKTRLISAAGRGVSMSDQRRITTVRIGPIWPGKSPAPLRTTVQPCNSSADRTRSGKGSGWRRQS
jgi:hypothetical protein